MIDIDCFFESYPLRVALDLADHSLPRVRKPDSRVKSTGLAGDKKTDRRNRGP